ncbi:MAG: ClbS/DfsB family four-helix bundle protein [Anaerolineae bacterium]|jgi:hypothetical protein|nr:ClbS/DfsB family four-helix bundle protein [Anaerolineae bacterium]
MPRPTSKTQLLDQSRQNFDLLQTEIAKITPENRVISGIVGEWSVKDVLGHLYEWQQMVLRWYQAGKRGETPKTPHANYNWGEIPALNQHIYEMYRDIPLDEIQQKFNDSHEETMKLIEGMTDEELFTPKVYAWTKTTTLGSYWTSATCSHYDWAYKEIKRGFKAKNKA